MAFTKSTGKKPAETTPAKKTRAPRNKRSAAHPKPPVTARARGDVLPLPPLLVVGIGASAGGIEALKEFFTALPADNRMAFVVIQHLDPDRESLMANLLGPCTAMDVTQIKRRTLVKPNHVYVTPPNKYVTISNGHLGLTKPVERRGAQMAVNFFFHALARDQHEGAVGVVLSGTGADGSTGLRSIKECGGMSIAQEPKEAAYDAMPSNAINTGMVDYILPIKKMAGALLRYAQHPYVAGGAEDGSAKGIAVDDLTNILALMRTRLKRDFRYYKKSTLVRRVTRRMGIVHVTNMKDYLTLLRKQPVELNNLFNDLLINVTQFFRDTQAFEALAKTVIPRIIKNLSPDTPIRVWVSGCSSGEEAYSIGMLLIEALTAKKRDINFQIFATDIDAASLDKARNGCAGFSSRTANSTGRLNSCVNPSPLPSRT